MSLTWTPPATNGGTAITGYRVYHGTAPGAETLLARVGITTSYHDTATALSGSCLAGWLQLL